MNDELEIPAFLRREDTPEEKAARAVPIKATRIPPPDNRTAERTKRDLEVLAEFAAVKKTKTKARIAKLVASKSGATAKMPVQGKAALALISGKGPLPVPSEAPSTQRGVKVTKEKSEPTLEGPVEGVESAAVEQSVVAEPQKEKAVKSKKKASNNARTPLKNGHANGRETKTRQIIEMLRGKHGVTTPEVLAAVDWPSISMEAVARSAGIKLLKKKEKGERYTRYFAA